MCIRDSDNDTHTHYLILENKGVVPIRIVEVSYFYPNGSIIHRTDANITLPNVQAPYSLIVTNVDPGFMMYRVVSSCPNVYEEGSP